MTIILTIEQPLHRSEKAFFSALQAHIDEANQKAWYKDCRDVRSHLSLLNSMDGHEYVIGGGGSHLWIHRKDQHVEGSPVESQRLAIITEEE